MNKIILFLVVFLCFCGCSENSGDINIDTGGSTATNENQSESKVEQSQLDELLPALICTECDLAQIESAGRMYDIMHGLITGQSVMDNGWQTPQTPLAPHEINVIVEAYTSSVADLTDGADTQTTEANFEDQVSDLLDAE